MPKRIVAQSVVLFREGKHVRLRPGPVDKPNVQEFTADEVNEISALNPSALRKVIIEDPEVEKAVAEKEKQTKAEVEAAAKKAKDEAAATAAAKKTGKTSAADL
jgi:type IV secretory pathway VirD2 relaxase